MITKNFIRQKLHESLKGDSYTVYHGSPSKITSFVDEFVGSKEAFDQQGPDIYFTSSKDEASRYGKYLYTVTLTPRLLLDKSTDKTKMKSIISKMVKMATDWKDKAQNFDENPSRGLEMFIESTLDYNNTEKDVAQQIWIDFYKYEPVNYVRNMVKLGIDGLIVPTHNKDAHHIIVYNPSIIKLH